MIGRAAAAFSFFLTVGTTVAAQDVTHTVLDFEDLRGWAEDDHDKALEAFLLTCPDLEDPDWRALCGLAQQKPDATDFFDCSFAR